MATLYSLYVLVVYAFHGNEPLASNGVSLLGIIGAYYAGGITGGIVVGLLLPLAQWRAGATVIGIAAAFFVFLGIGVAVDGVHNLAKPSSYLDALVIATLVGGVAANMVWKQFN
jgi:hypothetical protein